AGGAAAGALIQQVAHSGGVDGNPDGRGGRAVVNGEGEPFLVGGAAELRLVQVEVEREREVRRDGPSPGQGKADERGIGASERSPLDAHPRAGLRAGGQGGDEAGELRAGGVVQHQDERSVRGGGGRGDRDGI